MRIKFPLEPFNTLVRNGTIEAAMQKLVANSKPEAAYFTSLDGHRGGFLVVDMASASEIPHLAEPWFLTLNAEVTFHPAMTPEDLGRAGLNALGKQWA
ncbi:MAG: panthothenate synthetase [Terracidiphilus sp.]|nr:panthothenate synthetase [Terracidiphilus sp.]